MAIRMLEGFETRQSGTYLARAWETLAGAITSFTAPRKAGSASAQATNHTLTSWPLVPADSNVWIIGFGYYMNATTCASTVTLMDDTATAQLSLAFSTGTTENTFKIAVKRGSTTLATSIEIQGHQWHYIEFKATVRTGANGAYELKVDGVSLLSDGSENTADTGADGASIFQFNWGGAVCRFDDIVIADDTGASMTTSWATRWSWESCRTATEPPASGSRAPARRTPRWWTTRPARRTTPTTSARTRTGTSTSTPSAT
jgi:hypothetical protein